MHLKTRSVKSGDSLGRRLIDAREKLKCSRERIARKNFLSLLFVEAVEQGEYDKMPEYMYAKAQLKKYLKLLKLSESEHMALFHEEYVHWKNLSAKTIHAKKQVAARKPIGRFELAPSFWQKSIAFAAGIVFIVYIGMQVEAAIAPVNLEITNPLDRITIYERSVIITGRADVEATVTINGLAIQVDADGSFAERVNLQTGLNTLEIIATKKYKPENTVTRHIIVTE